MKTSKQAWWKGLRGEWYVVLQAGMVALVALGPQTAFGLPAWTGAAALLACYAGSLLIAAGTVISVVAALQLGSNPTPLPHPRGNSILVVTGLYRWVRHPIYCGVILLGFGWVLFVQGWLTLVYAGLLAMFFDIKSGYEERWLVQRFPDYAGYQSRVKKLIPFVY